MNQCNSAVFNALDIKAVIQTGTITFRNQFKFLKFVKFNQSYTGIMIDVGMLWKRFPLDIWQIFHLIVFIIDMQPTVPDLWLLKGS